MSGIVRGVKKVVKGVGRFVKKYWKPILAAVAVVFTAGLATVGFAGFSAASAAAAAGGAGAFGATMSAIGSTMTAGIAAIGGSLGIGKGVTAATAGGAFAAAPAVQGALAASGGAVGATIGSGAAAQALGLAPGAATFAAGAPAGSAVGPNAALAGVQGAAGAAPAATQASGLGSGLGRLFGQQATAQPSFWNSPMSGVLAQGGVGLVNGYMQGRAMEDAARDAKPLAAWGVPLRREGGRETMPVSVPGGPMWSPDSFRRPANAPALMMQPNDPTGEEWQPEQGYFGGRG